MIICSWNINGIRSLLDSHDLEPLTKLNIDVLLLQEVRSADVSLLDKLANIMNFSYVYRNISKRSGHAGVATMTRLQSENQYIPENVLIDEGRIIVIDIGDLSIVNLYSPYIGRDLVKLDKRTAWEDDIIMFFRYLKKESRKIIIGGDLNVAPTVNDRYRVSINQPGCSTKEAEMFYRLKDTIGLRDAYREIHGDKPLYTTSVNKSTNSSSLVSSTLSGFTWGVNEGKLRIDYFLVDKCKELIIKDCEPIYTIHACNNKPPSDHYPLLLEIEVI